MEYKLAALASAAGTALYALLVVGVGMPGDLFVMWVGFATVFVVIQAALSPREPMFCVVTFYRERTG